MPGIDYHRGRGRATQQRREQKPDPIPAHEICAGCIVWLGLKEDAGPEDIMCVREGHCGPEIMKENRYCHPVLVLEVHQRLGSKIEGDLICLVTDLTTFAHTPLQGYIEHQELIKFRMSIPIYHGEPSRFDHVPQLHLVSGQMPEKTYARFQHIWQVPISSLVNVFFSIPTSKPYDLRIDQPSYKKLMELFERPLQEYFHIDQVLATAEKRLTRLAGNENVDELAGMLQNTVLRERGTEDLESQFNERRDVTYPGGSQQRRPPRRGSQLNPEAAIFTPTKSSNPGGRPVSSTDLILGLGPSALREMKV